MITALCDCRMPSWDSACRICGSAMPPMAKPPIFRKLRREIPSQSRAFWLPYIVNILRVYYSFEPFLILGSTDRAGTKKSPRPIDQGLDARCRDHIRVKYCAERECGAHWIEHQSCTWSGYLGFSSFRPSKRAISAFVAYAQMFDPLPSIASSLAPRRRSAVATSALPIRAAVIRGVSPDTERSGGRPKRLFVERVPDGLRSVAFTSAFFSIISNAARNCEVSITTINSGSPKRFFTLGLAPCSIRNSAAPDWARSTASDRADCPIASCTFTFAPASIRSFNTDG